jgi:hypothetical protein
LPVRLVRPLMLTLEMIYRVFACFFNYALRRYAIVYLSFRKNDSRVER